MIIDYINQKGGREHLLSEFKLVGENVEAAAAVGGWVGGKWRSKCIYRKKRECPYFLLPQAEFSYIFLYLLPTTVQHCYELNL